MPCEDLKFYDYDPFLSVLYVFGILDASQKYLNEYDKNFAIREIRIYSKLHELSSITSLCFQVYCVNQCIFYFFA